MRNAIVPLICAALLLPFTAKAETVRQHLAGANHTLTAYYNATTQPGDAVFVRLVLTPEQTAGKPIAARTTGSVRLYAADNNTKPLCTADLYILNRDGTDTQNDVLLSGLPLSSFLQAGLYSLIVQYRAFGADEAQLVLPVTVIAKDFVSETIPLDNRNTSIKTNTSSARTDQIRRLDAILGARNAESIYNTTTFVPPTPATRRTSFFADRRVYAYTGGGSSTSLHYGIDYGVPTGSEVRACARGKVVMAEDRVTTGWSVCIEHLPGLYSLYYHMSEIHVAVGDLLDTGDLVGLSGATGLATGPHLHWEVRLNMEAVSPDFFVSDFTFEEAARN